MEHLPPETIREVHALAKRCRSSQTEGENLQISNLGAVAIPEAPECGELLGRIKKLDRAALNELTALAFPGHADSEAPVSYTAIEERARREGKDPVALLILTLLHGDGLDKAVRQHEQSKP